MAFGEKVGSGVWFVSCGVWGVEGVWVSSPIEKIELSICAAAAHWTPSSSTSSRVESSASAAAAHLTPSSSTSSRVVGVIGEVSVVVVVWLTGVIGVGLGVVLVGVGLGVVGMVVGLSYGIQKRSRPVPTHLPLG